MIQLTFNIVEETIIMRRRPDGRTIVSKHADGNTIAELEYNIPRLAEGIRPLQTIIERM